MSVLIQVTKMPTFHDVIAFLKYGQISRIDIEDLKSIFSSLIYDPDENKFLKSQMSSYAFLNQPLRDAAYFKTSSAQSSILNLFALDKSKLYSCFFKIDKYINECGCQNLDKLIMYYDEKFATVAKNDVSNSRNLSEREKRSLAQFFDSYIGYLDTRAYNMNAKMLILFSLVNGEVIHLLQAVKFIVNFSEENDVFTTNKKYVIQSAMGDNLFVGVEPTYEPLNGEDSKKVKRTYMYSLSRDMLNMGNAVFEFEAATDAENREDDTISDYGMRKLPVFGDNFLLAEGMKVLMATGNAMYGLVKGSPFWQKKYYIKVGDRYLHFRDWHTDSRLILGKPGVKEKRYRWYIHQNEDKSIVITPSGGLQYYGFCIDIPNATQQTFRIPLWLFFKNGTNAQKFYLHEVSE